MHREHYSLAIKKTIAMITVCFLPLMHAALISRSNVAIPNT